MPLRNILGKRFPGKEDMKITIKDVARAAKVSISTVSKVINHSDAISDKTIKNVLQAIKDLNYVPNYSARCLASSSTNNVLFVFAARKNEAYSNPHMFDVMCGVQDALDDSGLSLSLVDIANVGDLDTFLDKTILQRKADGVIVHGSAGSARLFGILSRKMLPTLYIGTPANKDLVSWVNANDKHVGFVAAEDLIQHGLKDIGFVCGPKDSDISSFRAEGFCRAMQSYGLVPAAGPLVVATDNTPQGSEKAIARLILKHRLPAALICSNNTVAIGVYRALNTAALRIPGDVNVLVIDRYPYTQIMDPAPTILWSNVYELGRVAGETLKKLIATPTLHIGMYTTSPELIPGRSTSF